MEDKPRGTFTSDWQARAAVDQLSDTPPDGIPVVREQLWRPAHLPADTYWEHSTSPDGQMGPRARDGTPLCASIYTSGRLSGRGRGGQPDCDPGSLHASKEHQRSRNWAPANPEQSCASPASSAQTVSSAQAASHPARKFDLPAAARAGTVHALTGIKPAQFQPSLAFTLAGPHTRPTSDLPTSDLPTSDLPTSDLPTSDLPTSDLPTSDLPTSDLPASDLPTSDLPASDLPASDLPASDQRASDQRASNQPDRCTDADAKLIVLRTSHKRTARH